MPAAAPLLCLLLSCWAPTVSPPGEEGEEAAPLVFVQDGLIAPAELGAAGTALAEGRVLVARPWQPGEAVEVVGRLRRARQVAPAHPTCVALFRLGLGGDPPTAVSFDAEGARLRVARTRGEALVVDAWTGAPVAPEGFVPAAARPAPVPAGCPVEAARDPATTAPDGLRHAVVEGPLTERSGEQGWRVAVLR